MTGEGIKNANIAPSGLKEVSVINFTINVVEMELTALFDDTPTPTKFNINRPIYSGDANINSENPQLAISYNL
jgi:hypothetical protein